MSEHPDLDPSTYKDLNMDPNPVINGSEPLGNQRMGNPFTSLSTFVLYNMLE